MIFGDAVFASSALVFPTHLEVCPAGFDIPAAAHVVAIVFFLGIRDNGLRTMFAERVTPRILGGVRVS